MATLFTISATAMITQPQFNLIRKLATERNWDDASTSVSYTIKTVIRADEDAWSDVNVKRLAASQAIDFLLKTAKPVSTPNANQSAPVSDWGKLTGLLAQLPVAKYAIWNESAECWVFVEVREQKSTKKRYLNKLLGAPGHWAWASGISVGWMISMAETLLTNPTKFAMNYCNEFTRCSACDSPLSNKVSIAEAMGPVCRKKFKW